MTAPEIIVGGSLTIDNVLTADGRCLPPMPGGNVVYAALGARLWSRAVGLVSRAGCDYPRDFLDHLAGLGLDLGGIAAVDAPHGMNVAFAYQPDGSRVRAFPPEAVARIPAAERPRFVDYTTTGMANRFRIWLAFAPDPADLPAGWVAAARGVHLAALPVERHEALARSLRHARPDIRVHVDSPWYDERDMEADRHSALLGDLDLLLPSDADLLRWRPAQPPRAAAAELARATRRPVLVKQGAAGCTLVDADGQPAWSVPVVPVEAVDPTGAGDAFCGGLLAGLIRFGDLRQAALCGTVSASFAVEGAGADTLMAADPDRAERRLAHLSARLESTP